MDKNIESIKKRMSLLKDRKLIEIVNINNDEYTSKAIEIAKEELKRRIEKIKPTINIDILLRPFLELNIVRRDWNKGEKDKTTGIIKDQGEFIFLVKDILLARIPNETLLNHLKETNPQLYEKYSQKVAEFFNTYDPYTEPQEETKKLASILLNPDIYDFFALMRQNFYPIHICDLFFLGKIPLLSFFT